MPTPRTRFAAGQGAISSTPKACRGILGGKSAKSSRQGFRFAFASSFAARQEVLGLTSRPEFELGTADPRRSRLGSVGNFSQANPGKFSRVPKALDLRYTRVPAAQCHQAGMVLEHVRSWGIAWADSSYAARSACQIFGIVAVLPASLSILNNPDLDLFCQFDTVDNELPRIRLNFQICTKALLRGVGSARALS